MSDKNTKLEITKNVPFTVINRFLPKPEDQQELVEVLTAGISDEMAIQPGFIAASIQRSLDSNDVLVYAQWESADALAAAGDLSPPVKRQTWRADSSSVSRNIIRMKLAL